MLVKKMISNSERQVAVRLFSSLGSREGKPVRKRTMSEPFIGRPLSRQPTIPPPSHLPPS